VVTTEVQQKKPIPEQKGQHVYHPVPPRTAATNGTAPPSASPHTAGHQAGIHPEDMPTVTQQRRSAPHTISPPQADEDNDALYQRRTPSSVWRYPTATEIGQEKPTSRRVGERMAVRNAGHPKLFYALIVGGSIGIGVLLASVIPYFFQLGMDQVQYGYPRTWQTDVSVGHYPGYKDKRSHFIALNLHGYIEVIEMPEGVPGRQPNVHLYFVSSPANSAADEARIERTLPRRYFYDCRKL
jgi:hypothetical protein